MRGGNGTQEIASYSGSQSGYGFEPENLLQVKGDMDIVLIYFLLAGVAHHLLEQL